MIGLSWHDYRQSGSSVEWHSDQLSDRGLCKLVSIVATMAQRNIKRQFVSWGRFKQPGSTSPPPPLFLEINKFLIGIFFNAIIQMCSWGDFMPLFVNPPENTNQPFNFNNRPNKGDCIYSKEKECTDIWAYSLKIQLK